MPATKIRKAARATFSDEIKDAIERSGLSPYAIGKASGVDPGILSRFLRGERAMTTDTIDRLAPILGLHLTSATRGRGRPRKGVAAQPSVLDEPTPPDEAEACRDAGLGAAPDPTPEPPVPTSAPAPHAALDPWSSYYGQG